MFKYISALTFVICFQVYAQDAMKDGLTAFQKRDDKASLETSLGKFEEAHKKSPQDLTPLTYLARGYFTLAEFHHDDKDQKKKNFEKAREFGEKGLMLNPDYAKLAKNDIEAAIEKLTLKEVETLYWSAASLGKWAKLNGIMSSLGYKGQILAMIRRVEALKPDFFHAAVPRYWGGFYAVAPSIAGGDMKKSKKNFQKAMEMAPEYLGTKTLYAELYLVKEDEEKEFKKVLEEVLAAPVGSEEIQPENKMEKKKAERLLKEMKDLF